MSNQPVRKGLQTTLHQIEWAEPDLSWMLRDLRNMRVNLRMHGVNVDELLQNRKQLIRRIWKLGKAHELFYKGLLNYDGSLTKEAFDYLKAQSKGEIPSGILPGDIHVELGLYKSQEKEDK